MQVTEETHSNLTTLTRMVELQQTIRFDETATDYTIENETKIASCFLAGTMINTPSGLRAIETLRQGDKVNTSTGTATVDRLILSTVLPVEESQVYTIPKNAFDKNPSAPVSASKRHEINGMEKWKNDENLGS